MHNVFVYGTLRTIASGGKLPEANYMLSGFQMYDYGKFPYIVPDPDAAVYGNMLVVNDEDLAQLDKYENVSGGLYTREEVDVQPMAVIGDVPTVKAFVYVATSELHPKKVTSGDWFRR